MSTINFTNCPIDLSANYGGSDRKRGIIYNNEKYMLKISDRVPTEKRNDLNTSYSNSAYSEYIGCHILNSMGFNVQDTLLGEMSMMSSKGEIDIYPAVACKNFVQQGENLVEFKFIENALLNLKPTKIPKIEDLYELMCTPNVYFSNEFGKIAMDAYWDMFIADSLLGNFDRHANNWGYIVNDSTHTISLAPIYDCGSCLYPQLADDSLARILESKIEIQKRIEIFPTAALTLNNNKLPYKQYISSFANEDCNKALLRIAPKINIDKICKIVQDVEGISQIRKVFYQKMLSERYSQIILEPYKEYCRLHNLSPQIKNTSICENTLEENCTKAIERIKESGNKSKNIAIDKKER